MSFNLYFVLFRWLCPSFAKCWHHGCSTETKQSTKISFYWAHVHTGETLWQAIKGTRGTKWAKVKTRGWMAGGWITGHRRMSDFEAVIQTQMFGRVVRRRLAGTFTALAVTQPWHREAAGRRRSSPAGRVVQCIMTKKSMLWCQMYVCCRRGLVSQWGTCPQCRVTIRYCAIGSWFARNDNLFRRWLRAAVDPHDGSRVTSTRWWLTATVNEQPRASSPSGERSKVTRGGSANLKNLETRKWRGFFHQLRPCVCNWGQCGICFIG